MSDEKTTKKPGLLKRNILGVQADTISKVAAQIAAAESAKIVETEIRQIPISNIKIWDEQPRTVHLTMEDIFRGFILNEDKKYGKKVEELEGIISLAFSIKYFGLLNPPVAYALPGKTVQLISGQRRTMAMIYAIFHISDASTESEINKFELLINENPDPEVLEIERISVKVFLRKPEDITKERMGILDNVQRADLSIADKLRWAINHSNELEKHDKSLRWRDLVSILALSRSQSYEWLSIIQNRKDYYVSLLIEKVINEQATFGRLLELSKADVETRKKLFNTWYGDRPVPDSNRKFSLGKTDNYNAIKKLVLNNVDESIKNEFEALDWNDPKLAKKGFAEFLNYWIKKNG